MSSGAKVSMEAARRDAEAVRALFPPSCYERWEIAGSVRRGCALVGDVEHVVIPALPPLMQPHDFEWVARKFWAHLEHLTDPGGLFPSPSAPFERAVYRDRNGDETERWGERYRGVVHRMAGGGGVRHEIFLATPQTWGYILLLRTGPGPFGRWFVSELPKHGLRAGEGEIRRHWPGCADDGHHADAVPTHTEADCFGLVGLPYLEPAERERRWGEGGR